MEATPDSTIVANERSAVDDWHGLGDLVALAAQRLTEPVEGVHHAITKRWSRRVGPGAGHGALDISGGVYRFVRLAGSVAGASLGIGAATLATHRPIPPLWSSPLGAGVQAGANALWGDEFARLASPLHVDMGVRDGTGEPVVCDAAGLTAAFPAATSRLVVLLHGLGRTERSWTREERDSCSIVGVPHRLEMDGFTPVLVRYNTGKSVSDNGAALTRVLEDVSANWPTEVEEIVLIGHSMGGLVARSSLLAGRSADHSWVDSVRNVVTLGTPHNGSPIEKGVALTERILDKDAVSRPVGQFVGGRSAGIKDMRHGSMRDDRDRLPSAPGPDGIRHHHVAGVVTHDPSHVVGLLVGDLVVRVTSATSAASNTNDQPGETRVFGGLHHMGMLYDDDVLSQVREWLTPPPPHTTGPEQ